ncbi:MAG: RNA polymerase sigma factor [Ruminiclostridium sp.]|nr:RNA polymerase sigma factor [Ruminiclostridium sp.]
MTDEELYSRYLAGDTASYDELLIRLGNGLIVYINGYLHNLQDSEDLMIEAFARIMAKRPHIRGSFKAYLYRTARNLAFRFYSSASRTKTFSIEDVGGEITDGSFPEIQYLDSERKRLLHLCLDRIDPKLKEALWLIYFDEMSYADAAAVMGVTKKRIDKLLQKGKEMLRAELEKEGITNAYE